jgi:hypothetical protein
MIVSSLLLKNVKKPRSFYYEGARFKSRFHPTFQEYCSPGSLQSDNGLAPPLITGKKLRSQTELEGGE